MSYTNRQIVRNAVAGLSAVSGSGNMSTDHYRPGFTRYGAPYHGHLPARLARILDERFSVGAISQVIYSYATPIAWKDGETWFVPDVYYSPTTSSRHQSQLYLLPASMYEDLPADAGISEYLQILNGFARFIPGRRGIIGTYTALEVNA